MRKLRFVLLFLAAVLIVGLFPGSYLRGNKQRASSGGGGGGNSASSDPKIFLLVEQGHFINLLPSVYGDDELLEPVGTTTEEVEDESRQLDVYRVVPGRSYIVFSSYNPNTKGDFRAVDSWKVYFYYGDRLEYSRVHHATTVFIPDGVTSVVVFQDPIDLEV